MNDHDHTEDVDCVRCSGSGEVMVCDDDYCHGVGYCMHGDSHACPACGGTGAFLAIDPDT